MNKLTLGKFTGDHNRNMAVSASSQNKIELAALSMSVPASIDNYKVRTAACAQVPEMYKSAHRVRAAIVSYHNLALLSDGVEASINFLGQESSSSQ